jgi:hypothetical protein
MERAGGRLVKIRLSVVAAVAFVVGVACQRWIDPPSVKAYRAPATVESQSFVLKDAEGRTRAELRIDRNGQPVLQFLDERGKTVLAIPGPGIIPAR